MGWAKERRKVREKSGVDEMNCERTQRKKKERRK